MAGGRPAGRERLREASGLGLVDVGQLRDLRFPEISAAVRDRSPCPTTTRVPALLIDDARLALQQLAHELRVLRFCSVPLSDFLTMLPAKAPETRWHWPRRPGFRDICRFTLGGLAPGVPGRPQVEGSMRSRSVSGAGRAQGPGHQTELNSRHSRAPLYSGIRRVGRSPMRLGSSRSALIRNAFQPANRCFSASPKRGRKAARVALSSTRTPYGGLVTIHPVGDGGVKLSTSATRKRTTAPAPAARALARASSTARGSRSLANSRSAWSACRRWRAAARTETRRGIERREFHEPNSRPIPGAMSSPIAAASMAIVPLLHIGSSSAWSPSSRRGQAVRPPGSRAAGPRRSSAGTRA